MGTRAKSLTPAAAVLTVVVAQSVLGLTVRVLLVTITLLRLGDRKTGQTAPVLILPDDGGMVRISYVEGKKRQ